MKRLVWGYILASVCGVSLLGLFIEPPTGADAALAFLLDGVGIAIGAALIHYGGAHLRRCKAVVELAASLNYEFGHIDAGTVIARTGESPVFVYQTISRAQRKGQLPPTGQTTIHTS